MNEKSSETLSNKELKGIAGGNLGSRSTMRIPCSIKSDRRDEDVMEIVNGCKARYGLSDAMSNKLMSEFMKELPSRIEGKNNVYCTVVIFYNINDIYNVEVEFDIE